MSFGLLSGIGSVLGGLGGIFGKKPKNAQVTTAQGVLGQAQGATEAAQKYGFNRLTLLGNSSPMMGESGGVSPLASVQMITDGLKDIDDVTSGDAARRRAADQLNLDLARLKLDQARSGVLAVAPQYAVNGISGPSPLGVRPVRVQQSNGGDLLPASGASYDGRGDSVAYPYGSDADAIAVPDPRFDRGTGVKLFGFHLRPAPGFSPASVAEEEYGDAGGSAYGAVKTAADISYNVGRAGQWWWDGITHWGTPVQSYTRGGERWKDGDQRKEEYPPSYWPRIRYTSPEFRP